MRGSDITKARDVEMEGLFDGGQCSYHIAPVSLAGVELSTFSRYR